MPALFERKRAFLLETAPKQPDQTLSRVILAPSGFSLSSIFS
jgi:hypothetical protein